MLGLIKAQAAAGDPAAIRDLKFLRSKGLIDEKPKATKEPMIWELFAEVGMYCGEPNRYGKRKYR